MRNARRVSLRTLSENQRLGTLCVQRVRKLCIVLDNLHKPPSFVEQLVGAFDELKVVFATREVGSFTSTGATGRYTHANHMPMQLDEYADPMPIVHVVGMGHPRADNMGFKLWRRQGSIPKPSINGYEIDEGHLITGQIGERPISTSIGCVTHSCHLHIFLLKDVEPLMLPTALQHVPWTTYQVTIASERKGRPQWASRIQGIDTNCHWNNVKRK